MTTYKIKTCFIALLTLIGAVGLTPTTFAQSSTWSTPVNLNLVTGQVTPINGTSPEQHPALSSDGLTLYFGSDRSGTDANGRPIGCGGIDIWVTQRDCPDCPWGPPANLDRDRLAQGLPCVINSSANDNASNLTPDGHLLFFLSFRTSDSCGGSDLYYTERENSADNFAWLAPRNLNRFGRDAGEGLICGGIGDLNLVNTPNAEGAPSYFFDPVTDKTVLYFSRSDQPTNSGDFDIFTSTLGEDGTWGAIARDNELSATPYRDTRNAIRRDGLEMLVASERPGFPGGGDTRKLWFSTRTSTSQAWSIPVLVPNLNSNAQDSGPAFSPDGNEVYFYSTRPGGLGGTDLYRSTRTLPTIRTRNIEADADSSCSATINPSDLDDGSFDRDGGPLTFSLDPAGPFTLGSHTVRLVATNNLGINNSALATITVVDHTPPAISGAAVDQPTLWPADHRMVDVTVDYETSDNCSAVNAGLSISSNEPVDDTGDGDTAPDWEIVDAHHVRLRAERSALGTGRIYTITISATDLSGNVSAQTVTVSVPHNR